MNGPQRNVSLPVIWPGVDDVPVQPVNMFLTQVGVAAFNGEADPAIVTLGMAVPPVVLGTAEEQATLVRAIGGVAVHTVCRVSMTRGRVVELIRALEGLVQGMDFAAAQVRSDPTS